MMAFIGNILGSVDYLGSSSIAICALIAMWLLINNREWCKKELHFLEYSGLMPGPPALPLIGNALYFACKSDDLLKKIVELSTPYDIPFRFWMGPKLFVGIKNPRDLELVFNSPAATHKPYEYRFLANYFGRGILTDSGATHKAHRKLIMPMVNGKVVHTFLECFDRQSRRCVECLESRVDTGDFDIMHYMDDCTLDMVLETIMGKPGTAQQGGYKDLIECSTKAIGLAHERTMKVWLYMNWIYNRTSVGQQFARAMNVLHDFAETLVAQKKEQYHSSESDPDFFSSKAVLDRLTAHNEKTKMMDDLRMRDEITNIWVPAQDPTALTSAFLFVMLGMHPEVQDKVREEVREVVGDDEMTMEHIAKLKYLEMVIKETIRLFPVGPIILRELQEDLEFETCTAPKGCTIALLIYMTHRDPKHWTDPEKFIPERFTPENSADRHPYAFVPFSAGIRGCIGRQYAMTFVKTMVSRIVYKYRIRSEGYLETLPLKIGVTIQSINGYKVSITRV